MPYGQYSPSGLFPGCSPSVISVVPFACRLSPLQPGYVMTVCAQVSCNTDSSASAHLDIECTILTSSNDFLYTTCLPAGLVGWSDLWRAAAYEEADINEWTVCSQQEQLQSIKARAGCRYLIVVWKRRGEWSLKVVSTKSRPFEGAIRSEVDAGFEDRSNRPAAMIRRVLV